MRATPRSPSLSLVLGALIGLGACAGKADDTGSAADASADVADDWASAQGEVLFPSCGFGACHGAGAGGLVIDGSDGDHARLVGAAATGAAGQTLVVPGDPGASYLLQKMRGSSGISGEVMPPGGALEADKVAIIEAWIRAGAPD